MEARLGLPAARTPNTATATSLVHRDLQTYQTLGLGHARLATLGHGHAWHDRLGLGYAKHASLVLGMPDMPDLDLENGYARHARLGLGYARHIRLGLGHARIAHNRCFRLRHVKLELGTYSILGFGLPDFDILQRTTP